MEATDEVLMVLDPKYQFSYSTGKIPKSYVCQNCGKTHVRLWREEGLSVHDKYVRCSDCLRALFDNIETDLVEGLKIESFVPAIPTESNSFFVGYKHISFEGMNWWKRLPL